jgi:hypothetical protein
VRRNAVPVRVNVPSWPSEYGAHVRKIFEVSEGLNGIPVIAGSCRARRLWR